LKTREQLVRIDAASIPDFHALMSFHFIDIWGVSSLSCAPFGVGPVAWRWSTWWVNRDHQIVVEEQVEMRTPYYNNCCKV